MPAELIVEGLYRIPLGFVNAYLLKGDSTCLIDTGTPGSEGRIFHALSEMGAQRKDLDHILVTHLHGDHTGSLEAIKEQSGAPAWMHPLDGEMVRRGVSSRPVRPAPVWIFQLMGVFMTLARRASQIKPVAVEKELVDGQRLPFARDLEVIHTPGHSAGHLAFLLPQDGGVLIAGDAAGNMFGLNYPPIFEDFPKGLRSLRALAQRDFQVAVFGHGRPILQGASDRFQLKWGG